MRTRKVTTLDRKPIQTKELACEICAEELVEVDESTVAVTCWRCAQKKVEPPIFKQPVAPDGPKRARGYHLMPLYIDPAGNVFHKGVERPELKGTLEPTPIKAKKTKAQKEAEKEKKEAKLAKLYKKKQRIKNGDTANKSLAKNILQENQ
jgi:hypothetical protein